MSKLSINNKYILHKEEFLYDPIDRVKKKEREKRKR